MIKHIVIWQMKENVSSEQKEKMKGCLEALQDQVYELSDIEVGIDFSGEILSLISEFASKEDLNLYQMHPAHQEIVAFVKPLVADRSVCDYEY